jgi:hypothetical protein
MHAMKFLHKTLSPVMHLKRLSILTSMVMAVFEDKKISVTSLGRALQNGATERSHIRTSDRLIGNNKLHEERENIYKAVNKIMIHSNGRPWVIVDWSHIPNTTHYVLRGALVTRGRTLTLHEEVHPKKKYGNAKAQKLFLKKLKLLLPEGSIPIIITDAGFQTPWFKEIINLGWDYVGRVRGNKNYRKAGKDWEKCRDLFKRANSKESYIGEVELSRRTNFFTHFYLVKNKRKGRISLNKLGKKSHYKSDLENSQSAKEPWLLATSLGAGKKIAKIYATRMQIEEGFRDLKSSQYGFSLEKARSKNIYRIENLLLIGMLASLIAWLTGWIAEKLEWHHQFQANSIRSHRVLSLFYLGCQVIKKNMKIPIEIFYEVFLKKDEWVELYAF